MAYLKKIEFKKKIAKRLSFKHNAVYLYSEIMTSYIGEQRRLLHIYKGRNLINTVTFQRGRNGPELPFRQWQVIHSLPGKALPFMWHEQLEHIKQQLVDGGYTWSWSEVQNYWTA